MSIETKGYAHPDALVSTEWVAAHLNEPTVRLIESNEDILLYETGHIAGAVKIDWHADINDPTVRDYIESGKNGLIIPKQRDALRDAVRRLYEDEALYRGMAKEGRCRFLESYSVASMARRIGSIWRKLDEKKC